MQAAKSGNVAEVKALLARGADVSFMDSDGFRAVDRAKDYGHAEVVTLLQAAEKARPAAQQPTPAPAGAK